MLDRRQFVIAASSAGAALLWSEPGAATPAVRWTERRDLFPEGVASGDPDAHSVLLWTRRPHEEGRSIARLRVEVSRDREFGRLEGATSTVVEAGSDWTCRVLAGGLTPDTTYFYRFIDEEGNGSRIGQTRTAPTDQDARPVRFAFVSCQNANQGAQNALRRMIWEDDRADESERLGFVLHLGDFIYEMVWYPEDRPKGMYDRRLRDVVRYASGEKIHDYHIPTTVGDYRAAYRGYLRDADIQDARARFAFVAMWDNHEFSVNGWQGFENFGGTNRPAQTRKVAANQAWFEYQPARVSKPSGSSLARFGAPDVRNVPTTEFDAHGLGLEVNNLAAVRSLTGYRSFRWGRNVEIILTDQHSYRSEDVTLRNDMAMPGDWLDLYPEEILSIIDAGRTFAPTAPPTLRLGSSELPNPARDAPAQTVLGASQKAWFKERLLSSRATWKIWGNTLGTLDYRADPLNLPPSIRTRWPGSGYAAFGGGDPSSAYLERAEIYDAVRDARLTGFATVAGDRHSFWAGYAAKALPPAKFEPVGVAFVAGSISAPGVMESSEYSIAKDHPLRPLYLADRPGRAKPEDTLNLTLRHGVRTAFAYAKDGKLPEALALSNKDMAPHLRFVDMGGHGYAVVTAASTRLTTDFVCVPRPLEASGEDGGPLRYRVRHATNLWKPGSVPVLEQSILEGDPELSAV